MNWEPKNIKKQMKDLQSSDEALMENPEAADAADVAHAINLLTRAALTISMKLYNIEQELNLGRPF